MVPYSVRVGSLHRSGNQTELVSESVPVANGTLRLVRARPQDLRLAHQVTTHGVGGSVRTRSGWLSLSSCAAGDAGQTTASKTGGAAAGGN